MPRKHLWIIGVDEVGRGPLAGPVTVAAVAAKVDPNFQFSISHSSEFPQLQRVRDSKKLTPAQRKKWNRAIRQNFIYSIQSVPVGFIDRNGITAAVRFAVSRCLFKIASRLKIKNCKLNIVLDGGLTAPAAYANQRTIIKGDERVPIIAAASIVAKVHRDAYMTRLAKKTPHYGFEKHKGYGTAVHMRAIEKHGLSEYHRKSFCRRLTAEGSQS